MVLCDRCGDEIRRPKSIDADALFKAMAQQVNYPLDELKRRRRPHVWTLQNIMYAMRVRGCKFPAIAKAIGRDHSDVIYGVKQVMKRLSLDDPSTAEQVQRLGMLQADAEATGEPSAAHHSLN